MKTIRYAIHGEDSSVISRVGNEIAVPVLNFESIGKGGDYTKPFEFDLKTFHVHIIGKEWDFYVWTRFVPDEIKNLHREFWGMKPLPVHNYRYLPALLAKHKVSFYYALESTIGIYHGNWGSPGLFHWFEQTENRFVWTGVSRDSKGAVKLRLLTLQDIVRC